jgi:WXXGXW repeat (2 copies)
MGSFRRPYIGHIGGVVLVLVGGLVWAQQDASAPIASSAPPASTPPNEMPEVPKGVEVMARGPVHEAFATLTAEPTPTKPVPKKPPEPLKEMPPDQKPEGDAIWVGGYWAYDDDRQDFLWVSGIWRTVPPGKEWTAGYWREEQQQWQWVPGFWTKASAAATQEVTYLPAPPKAPETAPPGTPPNPGSFYVPGAWVWNGGTYMWQAGYWAQVQPGYVWTPAYYRWTPGGYVFIPGYWDLSVARRGVLYAPVVVDYRVAGVGFVYTPAYAVSDTIMVDALFVRPCYCHYYFGDYYGPAYRGLGFESGIVYGRAHYDSIVVYSTWEHRADPGWATFQLDLTLARHAGRAPLPPRTLVEQVTIVRNTRVTNVTVTNNFYARAAGPALVTPHQLAVSRGATMVALSSAARENAVRQANFAREVAVHRSELDHANAGHALNQPMKASFNVPNRPPGMAASAASSAVGGRQLTASSANANGARTSGPPPHAGLSPYLMKGNQNGHAPANGRKPPPKKDEKSEKSDHQP